jgi:hypothetical protein
MSNKPSPFRRKNRTETLTFPINPDDASKIVPAQYAHKSALDALELASAPEGNPDDVTAAQAALDQARAKLDEVLADCPTITFHLRALSAVTLQAIQTDNPPTPDQIKSVQVTDPDVPTPDFNPETYPPALLAAACTGVEWSDGTKQAKLTEAEATEFYASSSFGDQQTIFQVLTLLNQLPSRVEALGKG